MFWKKKAPYPTTHVTDNDFDEVILKSKVPVLLDFYADWCGPCKMLGPIIDELAEEYEGKALVAKINTEHSPRISQYFKVKSIPTLMVFNKGNLHEQFKGIIPKPNLAEILDEYIAGTDEYGRLPGMAGKEE